MLHVKERKGRGRFQLVTAALQDDTGVIEAKWFGQRYLSGKLAPGDRMFVAGRVTRAGLLPEINVSSHKQLRDDERYEGEIVPVYGATKELPSRMIRKVIAKNLDRLIAQHEDALPPSVVRRFGFPPLAQAWREVHAPHDLDAVKRARERIVFDEFFSIALAAAVKRARREAAGGARALTVPNGMWDAFGARAAVRADRGAAPRHRPIWRTWDARRR